MQVEADAASTCRQPLPVRHSTATDRDTDSTISPAGCGRRRRAASRLRPTIAAMMRSSVELGDRRVSTCAPVAEHGDAVGELHDLVDAVRDVDDRDAVAGELPDDLEQPLAFGRRQGRGRLVHDQDAGVDRQRLGDLDQLLLADAQRRRRARRGRASMPKPPSKRDGPPSGLPCGRRQARRSAARGRGRCCPRRVSSGTRLSSWWMMAMPARFGVADAGEAHRRAVDRRCRRHSRYRRRRGSSSASTCRRRSRPSGRGSRRPQV